MASTNYDCPNCEPDIVWCARWFAYLLVYAALCYLATFGYRL